MIKFSYTGRNRQGKLVDSKIVALNKEIALNQLKQQDIVVINIRPAASIHLLKPLLGYINRLTTKPQLSDLIIFSRQMGSLAKAGVPLLRSLRIVTDTVHSVGLRLALENVLVRLDAGQSFSSAIAKHPQIFPSIMQALAGVGESTGNIEDVFKQVSLYLARENITKKRVKEAMRYPIFVIITICIAIGVINVLVIPSFAGFFARVNAVLPLPTRILLATSKFMINYWHVLLLALLALVAATIYALHTPAGKLRWDRMKLKIPLVGSIIERALLARFARSFALTSRTGVPLLESISVIANTTDNVYVTERIMTMRQSIEHGESLTIAAGNCGMFTPLVMQMILIGEETGELPRLLDEVADHYESELEYDLKRLSSAIEPILTSIVAAMVLVLALGVFLPMWDLSKVALGK